MKNVYIPLIIFLLLPFAAWSQIDLQMCLDSAIINHPLTGDIQLLKNIDENTQKNYSSGWYPDVNLKAQASYQSDIINLDLTIDIPGLEFPSPNKDQYKLYLDVRQNIYDGGRIGLMKEISGLSTGASLLETEKEIEKVKTNVINLFFNILLLQENRNILELTLDQINQNIKILRASVENGIAMASDVKLLEIEKLQLEQDIINLGNRKKSTLEMLSLVTGFSIHRDEPLVPTSLEKSGKELNRKELEIIGQNKKVLNKSADLTKSGRLPVVFAFGQAGYSNPGLNMLSDQFDSWYLVGIGLQWNILDWKKTTRDKRNILYQENMLENKEKLFTESVEKALINQTCIVNEHQGNINKYTEILKLRENISSAYQKRLSEGTVRAIDYINVLNQEKLIRLRLENEKILWQNAIADYNLLSGNLTSIK